MTRRIYLYELYNPDHQPFYVGSTVNPHTRKSQHKSDAIESSRLTSRSRKTTAILGLLNEGKDFTLRILMWTTDPILANHLERGLIASYRDSEIELTNTWWNRANKTQKDKATKQR